MKVSLTDAALADLNDIFLYIALDDPASAGRMIDRLTDASDDLSTFPNRGRPGADPGTRELLTVPPYVIVYIVGDVMVEVVRIRHGAELR